MNNIAKKLTRKKNRKGATLTIEIFIVLIIVVIAGIAIFGSIAEKMDEGGTQIVNALDEGLKRNEAAGGE